MLRALRKPLLLLLTASATPHCDDATRRVSVPGALAGRHGSLSSRYAGLAIPARCNRVAPKGTHLVTVTAAITCPHCGHVAHEMMATDACQYFYDCRGCGAVLKPNAGDCCVFCSFGDARCPPRQAGERCEVIIPRRSFQSESAPKGADCDRASMRLPPSPQSRPT